MSQICAYLYWLRAKLVMRRIARLFFNWILAMFTATDLFAQGRMKAETSHRVSSSRHRLIFRSHLAGCLSASQSVFSTNYSAIMLRKHHIYGAFVVGSAPALEPYPQSSLLFKYIHGRCSFIKYILWLKRQWPDRERNLGARLRIRNNFIFISLNDAPFIVAERLLYIQPVLFNMVDAVDFTEYFDYQHRDVPTRRLLCQNCYR